MFDFIRRQSAIFGVLSGVRDDLGLAGLVTHHAPVGLDARGRAHVSEPAIEKRHQFAIGRIDAAAYLRHGGAIVGQEIIGFHGPAPCPRAPGLSSAERLP